MERLIVSKLEEIDTCGGMKLQFVTEQQKKEEAKTALVDINMYQGWTAEFYKSTSKDEQNRVNEGKMRQQKEDKKKERIQIPMKIISPPQQKKKQRT